MLIPNPPTATWRWLQWPLRKAGTASWNWVEFMISSRRNSHIIGIWKAKDGKILYDTISASMNASSNYRAKVARNERAIFGPWVSTKVIKITAQSIHHWSQSRSIRTLLDPQYTDMFEKGNFRRRKRMRRHAYKSAYTPSKAWSLDSSSSHGWLYRTPAYNYSSYMSK